MKLKKYLSVFIAAIILVSALPINGLITNVSAEDTDKIIAIKDAWIQLEKVVGEIQPSISGTHKNITPEFAYVSNSTLLPIGVTADKSVVGEYYTKVTIPTGGTGQASAEDSLGNAFLRYQSSNLALKDYNVRQSFYIAELNGSLSFVPFFRYGSSAGANTGKLYTVKNEDVGKWVTLTSEAIKGTKWSDVINVNNQLIFGINSDSANVIYFGSFIITEKVKLPADSAEWSLLEWKNAANALDLAEYYNTDALVDALAAAADKDDEKIKQISTAWKQMEEIDFEVNPGVDKKNIETEYSSSGNSSMLPTGVTADKMLLGSSYAKASFSTATATDSAGALLGSSYLKYNNPQNSITAEHNVYFSFYMSELKGNVSIVPFFRKQGGTGIETGKKYDVKTTDVGKWVTLKSEDLKGSSWNLVTDVKSSIILGINSDTVGNVIYCGSFLFTKKVSLPAGSNSWGLNEWRSAFAALDLSKYYNTEPIIKLFEDDIEYKAIAKISNAWRQMEEKALELMPDQGQKELEAEAVLTNGESLLPTGVEADSSILGTKYAKVTITTPTATNSVSSALGSSYVKYQGTSYAVNEMNIYLSIYLPKLNGNLSIVPFFRRSGTSGVDTGKEYTFKSDDVGKWITLKSEDLKGSSYANLTNVSNSLILGVNSDTENTLYLGSVIFTKYLTLPEESKSWSLGQWIVKAGRLDLTEKLNVEQFKTALAEATEIWKELGAINYTAEDMPDDLTTLGENRILGIAPEISYYSEGSSVTVINESAVNITDGDITTSTEFTESPIGDGKYIDAVFYFGGGFVLEEKYLLAMPEGSVIGEYEIYSSDSRETLFAESNKVITVKKDSFTTNSHVLSLFAEQIGSYVAYRFKEADGGILKLSELGVYGKKQDVLIETGNFSNNKIKEFGTNLIKGDQIKIKVNGNITNNPGLTPSTNLSDGDVTSPYSIASGSWNDGVDDSKTCDIYFDLGASYKLDKFFLNSWYEQFLETGKYEIYVSSSLSELFLSSKRVLSYNNMADSENGTTISQVFTFEESNKPIGRYVCFRIRCSISDFENARAKYPGLLYVRLTEIGAYGVKYTPPAKPINMLNHVPVDIYRTQNSTSTKVDNNELTAEQIKCLGDGDSTVAIPLKTNGKQLDYVFNLCGSMKLDALNLLAESEQIKSLKIYAADNAEDVWEEDFLAYTSTNSVPVKEIKNTPAKQVTARYLRYSVVCSDTEFKPTEFEAIGMDNQALTYRNLLLENPSAIGLYSMEYNSGYFKMLSEKDNKLYASVNQRLSYVTDGEAGTVFDIYSAETDKSSIDLLVDLGSLHAVDSLKLKAGSDSNHWPSEMKIYMHQTEDGVMSADSKVAYTFVNKAENGIYSYEFSPQYVRYVRFQITKAAHPYLKSHLMTVISELEVMGMSVSGRVAEDANAVLSFADKATGIKVNILKNDDNDVYSGVASVKITPIKATSSEKESLKSYSMMIYGSTKYSIKLFDRNGKEVKDIGGREMEIFIPTPKGEDTSSIYVGKVGDGTVAIMNTSIYDDKVSAVFTDPNNLNVLIAGFVVNYPEGNFDDDNKQDNSQNQGNTDNSASSEDGNTATENKLVDELSGIAVIYQDGILPNGTALKVEKAGSEVLPEILAKQLKSDDFAAYKLSFELNGENIEPTAMVKMVFPVPEGMQGDKCKVYFIAADGKKIVNMNAELTGSELSFLSDKSGVYMITDKEFSVSVIREEIKGSGSKGESDGIPYGLIIGIVAAVLVLAAAAIIIIIFLKKRKIATE